MLEELKEELFKDLNLSLVIDETGSIEYIPKETNKEQDKSIIKTKNIQTKVKTSHKSLF